MLKYYIIIAIPLMIISCEKGTYTPARIPEACFYADRINVNRKDTVTFTNCSKADEVHFTVVKRNDTAYTFNQRFDKSNVILQVFNDSGLFDAVIEAIDPSPGSPIKEQRIPISVK